MHIFKKLTIIVAAVVLSQSVFAAKVTKPRMIMTPESLEWMPVKEMPEGAQVAILSGNPTKKEAFVARVKLPADYIVPVHSHPVNEYDTVISGTYYLGEGSVINIKNSMALPAGSFAVLPARTKHYGYTKEETIIQISGTGPWGMIYKKDQDEG